MTHIRLPRQLLLGLLLFSGCDCCHLAPAHPRSQTPSTHPAALPARTQLPIAALQQSTDYTCGPSCLVTLLRYYGRDGDEMQIAKEVQCNKETGANPQNMAAWLEHHGFKVTWGENGTLEMLRANLARGVPTLVEWTDWGGHWVIVAGYDTRGTPQTDDDLLIFADPWDRLDGVADGLTTFNAERFESMWFDAFLFGKPMHKVYITAEPAKK
jgi:ABC-type bacteriocin/lantibiotic exporter with double-glycine peptidase domain